MGKTRPKERLTFLASFSPSEASAAETAFMFGGGPSSFECRGPQTVPDHHRSEEESSGSSYQPGFVTAISPNLVNGIERCLSLAPHSFDEGTHSGASCFDSLSTGSKLPIAEASSDSKPCEAETAEKDMSDLHRLLEWTQLLDDDRLACLVEIAAVLAADQMGVYSDPADH